MFPGAKLIPYGSKVGESGKPVKVICCTGNWTSDDYNPTNEQLVDILGKVTGHPAIAIKVPQGILAIDKDGPGNVDVYYERFGPAYSLTISNNPGKSEVTFVKLPFYLVNTSIRPYTVDLTGRDEAEFVDGKRDITELKTGATNYLQHVAGWHPTGREYKVIHDLPIEPIRHSEQLILLERLVWDNYFSPEELMKPYKGLNGRASGLTVQAKLAFDWATLLQCKTDTYEDFLDVLLAVKKDWNHYEQNGSNIGLHMFLAACSNVQDVSRITIKENIAKYNNEPVNKIKKQVKALYTQLDKETQIKVLEKANLPNIDVVTSGLDFDPAKTEFDGVLFKRNYLVGDYVLDREPTDQSAAITILDESRKHGKDIIYNPTLGNLYQYQPDLGYWELLIDDEVKKCLIREGFFNTFHSFYKYNKKVKKGETLLFSPTNNLVDAVLKTLKELTVDTKPLDQMYRYIPFINGVFDCKTKQLLPHSPQYRFTSRHEVEFKEGPFPTIDTFLNKVTKGCPAFRDLLECSDWRIIRGRENPKAEREVFNFYGPTATGKSTYIDFRSTLAPANKTLKTSLKELSNNRFILYAVLNSWYVACPDEDPYVDSFEMVKKIIGGDGISPERKYKDISGEMVFYGNLDISSNEPLRIKDKTTAVYSRLVIVPFLDTVPIDERDPKQNDKMFAERGYYMYYLLNKWDGATVRHILSNSYKVPAIHNIRHETSMEVDPIYETAQLHFIYEEGQMLPLGDTWEAAAAIVKTAKQVYLKHCKEQGYEKPRKKTFKSELLAALNRHLKERGFPDDKLVKEYRKNNCHYLVNVRLRTENDLDSPIQAGWVSSGDSDGPTVNTPVETPKEPTMNDIITLFNYGHKP